MKKFIAIVVIYAASLFTHAQEKGADGWVALYNGKDLSGWKLSDGKPNTSWKLASDVKVDPADEKKLVTDGEGGKADASVVRLALPTDVIGADLVTEKAYGDMELEVEFMNAKGGNSGLYFMGIYELQACDSFGIPDNKMEGECGSIMWTKGAPFNACKRPGEWNKYHVVFRAPKFDANGKKVQNAKFVSVTLNGKKVQENVDVPEPTGGGLDPAVEKPAGPLLLQGNEGVIAFRNLRIKGS